MTTEQPENQETEEFYKRSRLLTMLHDFSHAHKVWALLIGIVIALLLSALPRELAHADVADTLDPMATDPSIGSFTLDQRMCLPGGSVELGCLWSTAKEVNKAQAGYFTKKSGFNPSNVFAAPAKTRDLFATHIANKITSNNQGVIYQKYDPARTCNNDQCLAYKMYGEIVNDASCATKGVPTNEAGTCARQPQSSITYAGVVNGISVAVCGSAVAIAVVTKAPPLVAGGIGGGCVWDAWKTWVFGH
jgi:hypothetical protein